MGFLTDEYIDYYVDKANVVNTKFSGGSRVLVEGYFSKKVALIAGIICGVIFAVLIIPIYFKYYFNSYPYIALLGAIGLFLGYAYGDPPFKLSYKGLGEIATAFDCGYLSMAAGYYISASKLNLIPFILSFPPALTVFCLAFINAYPDIQSDKEGGKNTLPVIFGIKKMNYVYIVSLLTADIFLLISPLLVGTPKLIYLFSIPSIILTFLSLRLILNGKYKLKEDLETLSLYTLLMMILSSTSILFSYLLG